MVIIGVALLAALVAHLLRRRCMPFARAVRQCDTGDLVLFRHRDFSITQAVSHYTHAGLVLVGSDGAKYIVESHARGDVDKTSAGVNVYDLAWRIRTYKGTVALARLRRPLDSRQRDRFARNLDRYRRIPFYPNPGLHYIQNCIMSLNVQRPPGMFCSEFIGHVQQKIGLRSRRVRTDCLTPSDLANQKYGHIVRLEV